MSDTKKAINLIKQMIEDSNRFLEKDVLDFLIKKNGLEKILEEKDYIAHLKTTTLYGNILSFLVYKNIYAIKNEIYDTRINRVNPVMPEETENELKTWFKTFQFDERKLFQNTSFEIESNINSNKVKLPITLMGLIAITDFNKFVKIKKLLPDVKLSKNDKLMTIKNILSEQGETIIYSYDSDAYNEATALISENWQDLKSFQKLEDHQIFTKILKSPLFNNLQDKDTSFLKPFVSEKTLDIAYTTCNKKSVLMERSDKFSSLQSIASPEQWLKILSEKNKKPLLFNLTSAVLELACGYGLSSIRSVNNQFLRLSESNHGKKRMSCSNEIIRRLDYFADELKKEPLSESDKILWYTAVIYTGNTELFLKSLSIVDFPKISKDSELLYEVYMGKQPEKPHLDKTFSDYYDLIKFYKSEVLDKQLDNQKNSSKKIKI